MRRTTAAALTAELLEQIPARRSIALFFANSNLVMRCEAQREAMHDPRVILVNDGIGLSIAARLFNGSTFVENLNGTDFTPELFRRATSPLRVFLVGGKADVVAQAATHVRDHLGQQVVGMVDGYQDLHRPALIDEIRRADPDIVLVAMGNPLQEAWILAHRDSIGAGLFVGVGALFDFWAGNKPRAPAIVRRLRLEWAFRLMLEPRRLARRYTVDIIRFIWLCAHRR